MKQLFIILLFAIFGTNAFSENGGDIKKELIQITRALQEVEVQLSQYEGELKDLKKQESKIFSSIAADQHHLITALQNLHHWKEYTPALIALSSTSLDDLIHSFLVLQSCTPKLETKNKAILEMVKTGIDVRGQVKELSKICSELRTHYQDMLKKQISLFESKLKTRPFSKTSEIEMLEETGKKLSSLPIEGIIAQLQTLFEKAEGVAGPLVLIETAMGKNLSDGFTLSIRARSGAQVVSPCDAKVVYIGTFSPKGQFVILKQEDFFLVLSGLGSLTCRLGESLQAGEPIGSALRASKGEGAEKVITLQIWKGVEKVAPGPYLKSDA